LREAGFSGINPFMIGIYGTKIVEQMDAIGMGWNREVDLVREASRASMFVVAFAFNASEARVLAQAGAHAIASHCGATTGGASGALTDITLDTAVGQSQEIFEAARAVDPEILLFAHGGPIEGPAEVQYVLNHTSAQGFIGGSAAERVPIETAIVGATREYKSLVMP
jgi:predicted TIM-barrel enzyme